MKIPEQYLYAAHNKGAMDTLGYFIQLRRKYRKPIFYNYTIKKIADLLGIALSCARKHVRKMIEMGWAVKKHGHFCLISIHKIKEKLVTVGVYDNKQHQKTALRFFFIQKNLFLQKKQYTRKSELLKNAQDPQGLLTSRECRLISSFGGVEEYAKTMQERITLSNRKIGKILGFTKRSASNFQRDTSELGLMKSEAFYRLITDFNMLGSFGCFFNGRRIIQRGTNTLGVML